MKKLLGVILLLSSTLSYGLFGLFSEVVCIENIGQVRGGSVYLPNEEQPFTGKNICKFINGQKKSEGGFKKGKLHGYWKEWSNVENEIAVLVEEFGDFPTTSQLRTGGS